MVFNEVTGLTLPAEPSQMHPEPWGQGVKVGTLGTPNERKEIVAMLG